MINFQSEHLYIRDSKGKERVWSVATRGSKIIVNYGLIKGKITEKITIAKPKNVGKANATTAEEQAVLEAKAKFTKQVQREDYNTEINKAGLQFRPMLALDYLKVPHRVDWTDTIAQPKLDGLRLGAGLRTYDSDKFELMTRKGETYNIPHLMGPADALLTKVNDLLIQKYPEDDYICQVLDGEAYIHGWSLQKITSAARKYVAETTDQLEYHIFDLYIPDMSFVERYETLEDALDLCIQEKLVPEDRFIAVPCYDVESESDLTNLQGICLENGFEGVMIRHLLSKYAAGHRSPDLFKFKKFFDMECKIIGVWEDKSGNAMFTCLIDGKEFNCTPKRTHKVRAEMLKNADSYLGKWLTVKYQALTDDGIPQFGSGLDIRECDEDGSPII